VTRMWLLSVQCSSTCGETGVETRYVACVLELEDDEQIVEDGYCDVDGMPDSERPCWPADCPQHNPVVPIADVVITDDARPTHSTAYWRSGTWGSVKSPFDSTHIRCNVIDLASYTPLMQ